MPTTCPTRPYSSFCAYSHRNIHGSDSFLPSSHVAAHSPCLAIRRSACAASTWALRPDRRATGPVRRLRSGVSPGINVRQETPEADPSPAANHRNWISGAPGRKATRNGRKARRTCSCSPLRNVSACNLQLRDGKGQSAIQVFCSNL